MTKKVHMLSFLPKTSDEMMILLRDRFRVRRKSLGYTQKELSDRSGVSLGSLKRFERSGEVSFESLLKLAVILECLEDFEGVCEERVEMSKSIDDVLGK